MLVRSLSLLTTLMLLSVPAQAAGEDDGPKIGHSSHGAAFDEGPRQRPWIMEGIGQSHFPITTSVPEVQGWFDQGNTLLHNFWWYEAERSFRWCLTLDPDCAMAYWGMARSIDVWAPSERRETFLREAVARMDTVTPRERMYIEAFARAYLPEFADEVETYEYRPMRAFKRLAKDLELIVLAYPDDVEAKALFALASLFNDTRYGNEAVIREILATHPDHPGAHHYRIHTWDGKEGAVALESCEIYGRLAHASGHANHMPGHIYSGIGLWHEGAIWMDSATRVEKAYMAQRMTLPFHNWNYGHNRNYLSFIQEQLGMPSLALDGARQLLRAPLDPKYNKEEGYTVYAQGVQALSRALVKYERWDDVLGDEIPWGKSSMGTIGRAYCEALAHLAKGDVVEAVDRRLEIVEAQKKMGDGPPMPEFLNQRGQVDLMLDELAGRIELARGNTVAGIDLLARAARNQAENYRKHNDPPTYPHLIYTVLGEIHLDRNSPGIAAECFEATLEVCPNDAFALSGLARARHALGDSVRAMQAAGQLAHVWSDAEPGLRWWDDVAALGLDAQPIDDGPRPQRNYRTLTLDHLGPETWHPYAAPALDALDATSKRVTLEEYAGRNVLLVFYLGESCAHCVEQLQAIGERVNDFTGQDVELLAISPATVEEHAEAKEIGDLPFRLLSDADHANARRFNAYDDFESMELHATILIDRQGRIRWARTGGDPFMDLDFLLSEIKRVNRDEDLAPENRAASAR